MSNPNKNSMSNHPPDASYEQLKTILDRVQGFHRRFRKGLADSNSLEDSPGRKHVLNWLQETEEREIELLNRVQSEQNTELLDTWIQYVPDSDCIQKLEDLELRPGMSLDEVHESTMRFYQSLSQTCQHEQLAGFQVVPVSENYGTHYINEHKFVSTQVDEQHWHP